MKEEIPDFLGITRNYIENNFEGCLFNETEWRKRYVKLRDITIEQEYIHHTAEIYYTYNKEIFEKTKRLYADFTNYCINQFGKKTKNANSNMVFFEDAIRISTSKSYAASVEKYERYAPIFFPILLNLESAEALKDLYPIPFDVEKTKLKDKYKVKFEAADLMDYLGLKRNFIRLRRISGVQYVARVFTPDDCHRTNFGTILVLCDGKPGIYESNPKKSHRVTQYKELELFPFQYAYELEDESIS